MRLILTTIILTMFTQAATAASVETLMPLCTKWKNTGYNPDITVDRDGIEAVKCFAYLNALSDAGAQNCAWGAEGDEFVSWSASSAQLAQFLLNKAEERPSEWEYTVYTFIVMNRAAKEFPCKE
jgi:hypothetical protein